jgi:hypothetical protein
MGERWQKDADGIFIFVSRHLAFILLCPFLEHYRPVYYLVQLLRSLP